MKKPKGTEFTLDGYITSGNEKKLIKDGVQYSLQLFQGEHQNEYTLRSPAGDVFLYEDSVLKRHWKKNDQLVCSKLVTTYTRGRIDFCQRFQDILNQADLHRLVNHKRGLRMEICSIKTGYLMYHGEFNDNFKRDGWGIEYDEESGSVKMEGIWSNGTLKEVIRLFKGETMTELKRNGKDSLDPVKRIPIYVGGFRYDEDTEAFVREGKGCLIDEKTGIATRECEWKDGREVNGIDLFDGWYNLPPNFLIKELDVPVHKVGHCPVYVNVASKRDFDEIDMKVTDLTICSNCCNEIKELDLSKFSFLQSIEIGDDCFGSVKTFRIDGLDQLKHLKIGKNSFTQEKNSDGADKSKSFHVLNCKALKSIEIGKYSFSDFAGQFELKDLNSLQSLIIGEINSRSCNFSCCSFEIKGI